MKNKNNHDRISPATYIVILLILAFCVYACNASEQQRRHKNVIRHDTYTPAPSAGVAVAARTLATLPDGVGRLLGNRNIFYGPQLDGDAMYAFLADFAIVHVVDLASEAKAEAILDAATERAICSRFGTKYHAFNIEGRGNRLNQPVMAAIDSLVELRRPIFIHCRNGLHRAKVTAGRAYARDGYQWQTIVDLLEWAPVVSDSKYDRYTNDLWEYVQQFNHPLEAVSK